MSSSAESVIGARIRSARKARGWSQERLAQEAGVSPGTVSSVEAGNKVRPGNLFSIRTALDITNDEPRNHSDLPSSVQTTLDAVKKWLLAQEDDQARDAAANELTRWIIGRL